MASALFLLLLAAASVLSCSGAPVMVESSAGARPSWIGIPSYAAGALRYYNGSASGQDSPEEARTAARQDALHTMAQEIAVQVGGEIKTHETMNNQSYGLYA